jgi:hypothetical protein
MTADQQDLDQNAGGSGWQPQPQPPVQPKKRHRVRTTVLASVGLVAALIVTVALAGGSKSASPNDSISSPSPAASAPAVPVAPPTNDPGDITDDTLDEPSTMAVGDSAGITASGEDSGTIAVSKLRISTTPYDEYGSGPSEKYFLIFTVKLRAEADGFDTAGDDFYVKTGNGERVSSDEGNSYDAVDYDKTMGYEELNDGEHVTKLLVFDSPSKHGTLNYAPNYEGGPIATWTF